MRRTRYDIMIDILKLCIVPRKKTEIVYECNLNFNIIKKHLFPLIKVGWIKEENSLFRITEYGSKNLDAVAPAMMLLSECLT